MLWPLPKSPSHENLEKNLPFELTEDQKVAVNTILSQTIADSPAAFLLQGDVGSGKTITALLIALHYIDNHIQVVFLAPTEILARQHYQTIYKFMGNMPFLGIELLLGGENKKTTVRKANKDQNRRIQYHHWNTFPVTGRRDFFRLGSCCY